MNAATDTTIFDKQPRFMGIYITTSLIGIILISMAVYRASYELEIIHEVDNMNRIIPQLLGEKEISHLIAGDTRKIANLDSTYRFYVFSGQHYLPLHDHPDTNKPFFESVDLDSTRINSHGGYFENDGQVQTWVLFETPIGHLLVLHTFESTGYGSLLHVYKQRMIIPVFFYIWLMIWITFIFKHLLQKLKVYQAEMKQMALYDALTQLPNRKLLEDRLLKLIKSSQREKRKFACCLIDLNDFKTINDHLGHAHGDELLKQASKRIESVLRDTDTAARLGGDEFVILLDGIDEFSWHRAFSRVQSVLSENYCLIDTDVKVGASLGVAIYNLHGKDAESLLQAADKAMYAAKANGGGICLYEPVNLTNKTGNKVGRDDLILTSRLGS